MRIDHLVIHIDNTADILYQLQQTASHAGFLFLPDQGKSSKGFKTTNIFVGRQYLEIVRITNQNDTDWEPHWVERYKNGKRGIFCFFLQVNNIEETLSQLKSKGFKNLGISKDPYGSRWKIIYTPVIPYTNMEIGFIEYQFHIDEKNVEKYFQPNSSMNGITGITAAKFELPRLTEVENYLERIFNLQRKSPEEFILTLSKNNIIFTKSSNSEFKVYLKAFTKNSRFIGKKFIIENVEVENVSNNQ